MRKLREILRLRLQAGLSIRQVRDSLRISLGAIQKISTQAEQSALDWAQISQMNDTELARHFYPKADTRSSNRLELPNWSAVHKELRYKGMTKYLLWEEYTQQYPNRSYSYAQYCHLYMQWRKKQQRSMRQVHKAGDMLFVDYAGHTVPIVSRTTGEIKEAQVFVAVMGASNYTYADATFSQSLPDWLNSHARALTYFGGVPRLIVPDNLKSGVTTPCRYDPDLNPSYQQLASHYGCAIMPARPRKPQDKSKAEVGVQVVERWILARLRHHTFFSLAELNHCIESLLEAVNARPFKQFEGCRKDWFEAIDKPALAPLPREPYSYTDVKMVKLNIDYHVQYGPHLYSAPHHLVGERLELHASDNLIQLYFHNQRVASHVRQYHRGMTTVPEHMPTRHEKQHQWTRPRLLNWAKGVGEHTFHWARHLLDSKVHEQQAYRACLGLLNLTRQYPAQRINAACAIALAHRLYRLKHVKAILKSNQDKLLSTEEPTPTLPQAHENIRGPNSFQ